MRTLGLIGGTTWVSTAEYYKILNQRIHQQLGGNNSAKLLLYSVNFEELKPPPDPKDWSKVIDTLSGIAKRLEAAGAECIVLCANTLHMVADNIQQHIKVPIIHIAEETAKNIAKHKIKKIGLLGTKFTMEQKFFKDKLSQQQIETIIPDADDREFIHHSIFNELGKEIFSKETKEKYISIINKLIDKGAGGIIFGCTEIPMLLTQDDCPVPVFDTLLIHAEAAVEFAIQDS